MDQIQDDRYTMLNVDTYRYEGQVDTLFCEREEIWEFKRAFWNKDPSYISNDLRILQNELVDQENIKIFKEMMDFIEDKIILETLNPIEEPKYSQLLDQFKDTLLYISMMKTLEVFDDALRNKNIFATIKDYQMENNTLTQLQETIRWMKGQRFIAKVGSQNINLFDVLLKDFQAKQNSATTFEDEINNRVLQNSSKRLISKQNSVQTANEIGNNFINYNSI